MNKLEKFCEHYLLPIVVIVISLNFLFAISGCTYGMWINVLNGKW